MSAISNGNMVLGLYKAITAKDSQFYSESIAKAERDVFGANKLDVLVSVIEQDVHRNSGATEKKIDRIFTREQERCVASLSSVPKKDLQKRQAEVNKNVLFFEVMKGDMCSFSMINRPLIQEVGSRALQNMAQFQRDLNELNETEGVDPRAVVLTRFFAQEGALSAFETSKKQEVAAAPKPKADAMHFTLDDTEEENSGLEDFDDSPLAESPPGAAQDDNSSLRMNERKVPVDRGLDWMDLVGKDDLVDAFAKPSF